MKMEVLNMNMMKIITSRQYIKWILLVTEDIIRGSDMKHLLRNNE